MIELYNTPPSANRHKVRLMLSLLELPHRVRTVDFNGGEQKKPAFLRLNARGEIPVLTDNACVLTDSQAILVYLARRHGGERWLPLEAEPLAEVTHWLSVAANEIQNGPNSARRGLKFGRKFDVPLAQAIAARLLAYMNGHLRERRWLAADHATVADIACYPYLKVAPEGGIPLAPHGNVLAWMQRVEALAGFVPMFPEPTSRRERP